MTSRTSCMKAALSVLAISLHLALTGMSAAAEGIEPVDLYILGDDTVESLTFDHVDDPLRPTVLRFTGNAFSEVGPTGMYVRFEWFDPNRHTVMLGEFDLPGTTAEDEEVLVPIDVEFTLPFSPARVGLSIEGTGCCDQFRVQGEFQHSVVPEPSTAVLASIGIAALTGFAMRRRKVKAATKLAHDLPSPATCLWIASL